MHTEGDSTGNPLHVLPLYDKNLSSFIFYTTLGFKCEDVVKQLDDSLDALRVPSCDIFYLHFPCHETPIEDTLKGVNQLYKGRKDKKTFLNP